MSFLQLWNAWHITMFVKYLSFDSLKVLQIFFLQPCLGPSLHLHKASPRLWALWGRQRAPFTPPSLHSTHTPGCGSRVLISPPIFHLHVLLLYSLGDSCNLIFHLVKVFKFFFCVFNFQERFLVLVHALDILSLLSEAALNSLFDVLISTCCLCSLWVPFSCWFTPFLDWNLSSKVPRLSALAFTLRESTKDLPRTFVDVTTICWQIAGEQETQMVPAWWRRKNTPFDREMRRLPRQPGHQMRGRSQGDVHDTCLQVWGCCQKG